MLVIDLTVWSKLDDWRISVAPNDFEEIDSSVNFLSKCECTNGRLVPREEIGLPSSKAPFILFLDLSEAIGRKSSFHECDSVEMTDTCC